jgi:hypothetical protein
MITVDFQATYVNIWCLMWGVFFYEIFSKHKEGNQFRGTDRSALRVTIGVLISVGFELCRNIYIRLYIQVRFFNPNPLMFCWICESYQKLTTFNYVACRGLVVSSKII